jgi:hypothetical protein
MSNRFAIVAEDAEITQTPVKQGRNHGKHKRRAAKRAALRAAAAKKEHDRIPLPAYLRPPRIREAENYEERTNCFVWHADPNPAYVQLTEDMFPPLK